MDHMDHMPFWKRIIITIPENITEWCSWIVFNTPEWWSMELGLSDKHIFRPWAVKALVDLRSCKLWFSGKVPWSASMNSYEEGRFHTQVVTVSCFFGNPWANLGWLRWLRIDMWGSPMTFGCFWYRLGPLHLGRALFVWWGCIPPRCPCPAARWWVALQAISDWCWGPNGTADGGDLVLLVVSRAHFNQDAMYSACLNTANFWAH